jgi:hypothetical protein
VNRTEVRDLLKNDRRLIVYELAGEIGILYCSYQVILRQNLGMWCVSAKLAPQLLMQKGSRLSVASGLPDYAEIDNNLLKSIIMGDGRTWAYGCDSETKQQSSQWESLSLPRPGSS